MISVLDLTCLRTSGHIASSEVCTNAAASWIICYLLCCVNTIKFYCVCVYVCACYETFRILSLMWSNVNPVVLSLLVKPDNPVRRAESVSGLFSYLYLFCEPHSRAFFIPAIGRYSCKTWLFLPLRSEFNQTEFKQAAYLFHIGRFVLFELQIFFPQCQRHI